MAAVAAGARLGGLARGQPGGGGQRLGDPLGGVAQDLGPQRFELGGAVARGDAEHRGGATPSRRPTSRP